MTHSDIEQLYSKVDILYFLIDLNIIVRSCNSTALEVLEYEKEEILGKNFLDFVCFEDLETVQNHIALCFQRGYIRSIQTALVLKSRQMVYVRINGLETKAEDGDERFVRLYVQDVSRQVLLENQRNLILRISKKIRHHDPGSPNKAFKEILAEIQKSFNCEGIGLSLQRTNGEKQCFGNWKKFDAEQTPHDFRRWTPERWNRFVTEIQGQADADRSDAGSVCIGALHESAEKSCKPGVRDLLRCFGNYNSLAVLRLTHEDWSGFLVLADPLIGKFDKSEMTFLEEVVSILDSLPSRPPAVRDRAEETAVSELPNIPFMGVLSTKKSEVQKVNPWILNFLETDGESLKGKTLFDLVDSECHSALIDIQNSDSDIRSAKIKVWTREGKSRTVLCAVDNRFPASSDEKIWYWMEAQEQADPKGQLLHTKKMETLGMLAGSIVLDFNNMLACILGYSSLLSENFSITDSHYPDLQQIIKTTEKAIELTSRLMACAQGSPYVINDLDVNLLVNEVAGILSKTFAKDLLIRAELDPKLGHIHADASRIQQAILEVALNAREATPNGGKIVFQTRNCTLCENDVRSKPGVKPGNFVQIAVSDTGFGMSLELKKQLFERDPGLVGESGNNGIGFSMVRQIVEEHQGFISVFSEKGQGTVFKMYLPVPTKTDDKTAAYRPGGLEGGREMILLVEDETMLRETGRKMLKRYGYQVIPAESGSEAVELYKKYGGRIDLIILDMMLPGIEINKVLEWLFKLNSNAKILAAVGKGEKDSVERSLRYDVEGYVQKPFHIRPLIQSIRAALNA
jgi:PAS domain S-box-containing protein